MEDLDAVAEALSDGHFAPLQPALPEVHKNALAAAAIEHRILGDGELLDREAT